jgi:hypothetical protein
MGMVGGRPARPWVGTRRGAGVPRGAGVLRRAAVLLVVLGLVSCSGDDEPSQDANPAGTAPAASGTAGSTPGTGSAVPPAPALPVLASRDASVKEIPVRVDLNELLVEGRVTRLTFTARNLEPLVPGRTPKRWQIAAFFNDGLDQKKTGASPDDTFSVDGVYLVDGAGAKRYLAARNASQGCVCSGDLSRTFVSPSSGVVLTTLFAALPAGVNAVDVVVPGFGSFNGVKVSR